jgi:hypothetical protein
MFASFGLGAQELLLLGVLALIPVAVIVIVLLTRASGSSNRMTELEDENRRLREELDRERMGRNGQSG